ncbi:MAG: nuclear transport factor 2 family protein [Alphaproteobacteria bacterium]|nr:MAG: nuclear transport factor 2 family protein [Alphaproteobacteria bacterium]
MNNNEQNLHVAENHYKNMVNKDFDTMETYLHDDIQFVGPISTIQGKDAVIAAAKNFSNILNKIDISSKFASNDQVMFAYDLSLSTINITLRAAVLMDFQNGKIKKIETFYDPSKM